MNLNVNIFTVLFVDLEGLVGIDSSHAYYNKKTKITNIIKAI